MTTTVIMTIYTRITSLNAHILNILIVTVQKITTGNSNRYWLVVWNMIFIFPYLWNVIIPTDELIFFRGLGSTTNQDSNNTNDNSDKNLMNSSRIPWTNLDAGVPPGVWCWTRPRFPRRGSLGISGWIEKVLVSQDAITNIVSWSLVSIWLLKSNY